MDITTPIPGLDNFMVVTDASGVEKRIIFETSSKFSHIARPGAAHKAMAALNLDFIVRAKDPADCLDLMTQVWGEPQADDAPVE